MTIAIGSERQGADWSGKEGDAEDCEGSDETADAVGSREELGGDNCGEGPVEGEVVPLD
jgi:hypothetical protein